MLRGGFILCVLAMELLRAQSADSAAIRGQVWDASGAAIPGGTVDLVNTETGLRRETRTDASGRYSISELPLTGEYRVEARQTGFAMKAAERIALRAGETAVADFTLSPEQGRGEVQVVDIVEVRAWTTPRSRTRRWWAAS